MSKKLKFNFKIIKNLPVIFNINIDGELVPLKGVLDNVITRKDTYEFVFRNGRKFEINKQKFNSFDIVEKDFILYFNEIDNIKKITPLFSFTMYESHGFPFDFTQSLLMQNGFEVSEKEFQLLIEIQKRNQNKNQVNNAW